MQLAGLTNCAPFENRIETVDQAVAERSKLDLFETIKGVLIKIDQVSLLNNS